ncbi:GGDEF domain-containing protein [Comamonas sp.]|uniref:GGDEF domain-containing protein n=1 Tax=Comamonas sp. TaxID=34028 RepID=UPI003A90DFAE
MAERTPADLARETLKLLALRRLAPTPQNYTAVYEEVCGQPTAASFPQGPLRHILALLPAQTPRQKRLNQQLAQSIEERSWPALQQVLAAFANTELELHAHSHPTLQTPELAPPESDALLPVPLGQEILRYLQALLGLLPAAQARPLEQALTELLHAPEISSKKLLQTFKQQRNKLLFLITDQQQLRQQMDDFVQLSGRHWQQEAVSSPWLAPAAQALQQALTPPCSPSQLSTALQQLRELMLLRLQTQDHWEQAEHHFRQLLTALSEQLVSTQQKQSAAGRKLEQAAAQLADSSRPEQASAALQQALAATQLLARSQQLAQTQLQDLQQRADQSETQIEQLRQQLQAAAQSSRIDELTGLPNRLGTAEMLEREVARARRHGKPLSVALLDMDGMRALNQEHGQATGDAALQHLAHITRSQLRPEDVLGRHDGQRFLLLLPEAAEAHAVPAVQRLQQQLQTHALLQADSRLLLSFGAGVAQLQPHEQSMDLLRRADAAMLAAKQRGPRSIAGAQELQTPTVAE